MHHTKLLIHSQHIHINDNNAFQLTYIIDVLLLLFWYSFEMLSFDRKIEQKAS